MNYEHVRELAAAAIEVVGERLEGDLGGLPVGDASCQLDELSFDQTFCEEDDEHDETQVTITFSWNDPNTKPDVWKDSILIFEEDVNKPEKVYWLAGMIYAKILVREKLF